jgi:hypothetical protein
MMDVVLKSLAQRCFVGGGDFAPGERVVSVLARLKSGEFERFDVAEPQAATLRLEGDILCRWTQVFKPRQAEVDSEREMRLSLESLFLGLYETTDMPEAVNHDLLRFLALFLERKRLLRARGPASERGWLAYEHARLKRLFLVPEGILDTAFFIRIQDQLGPLLGMPTAARAGAPTA